MDPIEFRGATYRIGDKTILDRLTLSVSAGETLVKSDKQVSLGPRWRVSVAGLMDP